MASQDRIDEIKWLIGETGMSGDAFADLILSDYVAEPPTEPATASWIRDLSDDEADEVIDRLRRW